MEGYVILSESKVNCYTGDSPCYSTALREYTTVCPSPITGAPLKAPVNRRPPKYLHSPRNPSMQGPTLFLGLITKIALTLSQR